MTERTAMNVTSAAGDVRYNANPWASVDVSRGISREAISISRPVNDPRPTTNGYMSYAPGTVKLTAMQRDVVVANRQSSAAAITLAPTDNGTVELLAARGLRSDTTSFLKALTVTMADVAAPYRRGAQHAFSVNNDTRMNIRINAPTLATNYDRGFTPAHINDINPARFYSMTETIPGANIVVPKPLFVYRSEEHTSELQSLMRISYAVFCLTK